MILLIYSYAQVVVQHVGVSHTLDLLPGHHLPRGEIIQKLPGSIIIQVIVNM